MVVFQKKWLALGVLPIIVLIATRQPGSSTEATANPSISEDSSENAAANSMAEPDQRRPGRANAGDTRRLELERHVAELESQIQIANQTIEELRKRDPLSEQSQALLQAKDEQLNTLRAELQKALSDKTQLTARLQQQGNADSPVEALRTENAQLAATLKKMRDREDILLDKLTRARNDLINAQGELDGSKNRTTNYSIIDRERNALRQELEQTKERAAKLASDLEQANNVSVNNGYLRTEMEKYRRDNAILSKKAEELAAIKPEYEHAINKLKELSAESVDVKATLGQAQSQLKATTEERTALKKSLEALTKEFKAKSESTQSLNDQLGKAQERVHSLEEQLSASEAKTVRFAEMEQALIKARNEVVLRETELKLLQGQRGPQERSAAQAARTAAAPAIAPPTAAATKIPPPRTVPQSDVLIGEVTEDKVNLRSGPGQEHAPVMQVQKGSRLTIEAKEGDWYRVITPTDTRAYVRTDVIRTSNDSVKLAAPAIATPRRIDDDTVFDSFAKPASGATKPTTPGGVAAPTPPIKFEDEAKAAFESLKSQMQTPEKR